MTAAFPGETESAFHRGSAEPCHEKAGGRLLPCVDVAAEIDLRTGSAGIPPAVLSVLKDAFISCAMYSALHRGFRVNSIELYSLKLI